MSKKLYTGRIYLGLRDGRQRYHWVGRFPTRKARDLAVAKARVELDGRRTHKAMTCQQWVDRHLARYERSRKRSSYGTAASALARFAADFGPRPIGTITRIEAMEWAERVPASRIPPVITLFNAAIDAELIDRNPFRGLARSTRGRADQHPPTPVEMDRILEACSTHDWYAGQMRALTTFAAYSGLRPGELFALEWADIDFEAMRIDVRRRVYKGTIDIPKSNKTRRVALTPPARDSLLGHPTRATGPLVFTSKQGKRLSQPTLSTYWGKVLARAKLDFAFYLATKHWCVHYMSVTLGIEPRVIAEQMGWSLKATMPLLAVYGHGDVGALEAIDRAFQSNVRVLRPTEEEAG